jgi:hypothetical protein
MPLLSQIMIRTALLWLGFGFTIGGLVLAHKGIPFMSWLWTLRMPHVHMLLVGWMVQLAYGVAFWILPRLDASGDRGNVFLVRVCYVALNGGVVLASLHDPLRALVAVDALRLLPIGAGVLYILATGAFAAHAWRRVVPFRPVPRRPAS